MDSTHPNFDTIFGALLAWLRLSLEPDATVSQLCSLSDCSTATRVLAKLMRLDNLDASNLSLSVSSRAGSLKP
jgi:hypothetical protein